MSTLLEDVKAVVAEEGNAAYGWLDDFYIDGVEVVTVRYEAV